MKKNSLYKEDLNQEVNRGNSSFIIHFLFRWRESFIRRVDESISFVLLFSFLSLSIFFLFTLGEVFFFL